MVLRSATRRFAAGGVAAFATLALTLPAVALPAPLSYNADDKTVTVDIGLVSDFHGQLVTSDKSGGGGGLSCQWDKITAANPDSVLVSNGDAVGGSAFESSIANDEPTLKFLNEMKLFASAAGNHEFDKGWRDFHDRVAEKANFPFMAVNLEGPQTDDILAPWVIKEVPYGTEGASVKVAFVGSLTADLPNLVSPAGIEGIKVHSPIAKTNEVAAKLKADKKADVVIGVMHEGYQVVKDGDFSKDVDALVTGHTHNDYTGTVKNGAGVDIPVVQPKASAETLGHLQLKYKTDDKTFKFTVAANLATKGCTTVRPEIQKIIDDATANANDKGKAPVGKIVQDFLRGTKGGNRGAESTAGNMLADAALWKVKNDLGKDAAHIGVINAGGIRADLLFAGQVTETDPNNADGVVTYREAYSTQPFNNLTAVVTLTGAQVKTLLEQQWKDGQSRPMLKLGLSENVKYTFDDSKPFGERITSVTVDGAALVMDKEYIVTGNNFLLKGGDSFDVFKEGKNYKEVGFNDLASVLSYFEKFAPNPIPFNANQRSLGLKVLQGNLEGDVKDGSVHSLAFSSLDFANEDELADDPLVVKLDGKIIGSYEVDRAVEKQLDTTGKATATFQLPAGEVGEKVLTVSVGEQVMWQKTLKVVKASEFVDVHGDQPFVDSINWMRANAISTGWDDGSGKLRYEPYQPVLRDQMAAFIFRLAGKADPKVKSYVAPATPKFIDVRTSQPFYREIAWMADAGISTGWTNADGTKSYRPFDRVLRDQMAAFLFRLAKNVKPATDEYQAPPASAFKDIATSNVFYRHISWMKDAKVSTGWGDGTYRPFEPVLRDQMAAFMQRLDSTVLNP